MNRSVREVIELATMRSRAVLVVAWTLLAQVAAAPAAGQEPHAVRPPNLRDHVAYRAPLGPRIDGHLNETSWQLAKWTEPFVDIEDASRPGPLLTRVKLLWDDEHLYVGADLVEPHVWGALTKRDTTLYLDNDFEIFLDPDGDAHAYYELEINALGTVWDLMLTKPYRDQGSPISGWDIPGLQSAVQVRGTVNDPSDEDSGWSVELAIPWSALTEQQAPRPGDQWRANFSRVQWPLVVTDSGYRKVVDETTGRPVREQNWVWSAQGAVNMHMPERWGFVQFSQIVVGRGREAFVPPADLGVRWALWEIYHAQRAYRREHEGYAANLAELGMPSLVLPDGSALAVTLEVNDEGFEASAAGAGEDFVWHIRHDGRIWKP
jgi:hypothetical protein